MSSPPAGNASGAPGPNWYPDPSIPGYIRYWDGNAWVPGSSRPEPRQGEPMPAPPRPLVATPPAGAGTPTPVTPPPATGEDGDAQAGDERGTPDAAGEDPAAATSDQPSSSSRPSPASDPSSDPASSTGSSAADTSGSSDASGSSGTSGASTTLPELRRRGDVAPTRPEPASAWGADVAQQGLGDQRITWGSDEDVSTSPVAAAGRVDPRGQFRLTPAEGSPPPPSGPDGPRAEDADRDRQAGEKSQASGERLQPASDDREKTVGLRMGDVPGGAPWRQQVHELAQQAPDAAAAAPSASPSSSASPPKLSPPTPATDTPERPALPQQASPGVPAQPAPPAGQGGYGYPQPGTPPQQAAAPSGAPAGQGGYGYPHSGGAAQPAAGQPAAGSGQPTDPFVQPDMLTALITPRRGDPAFASVGNVYPAGLGRRLLARLVDSLLPLGAAVAVALPLVDKARDHIQDQIDAAERAGVTRDIWLVDGTTGVYLAMVLGVLFGVSLLTEALPTGLWGRSLGKAVCRVQVFDVERQEKVSFGAALLRWLVYHVLGLLVVGVVGVLWCLGDKPWRQCWHDKAAGTFVAAPPR